MSEQDRIEIGNVCKCHRNLLGVVTQFIPIVNEDGDYTLYRGIAFDGRSWQSSKPIKLADNLIKYIDNILTLARKNGKQNEY